MVATTYWSYPTIWRMPLGDWFFYVAYLVNIDKGTEYNPNILIPSAWRAEKAVVSISSRGVFRLRRSKLFHGAMT